jgi:hypothetical protein
VRGQDTEVFPVRRQDADSLSLSDLEQLFFSALLVQRVNKVALWQGGIGIMTLNIFLNLKEVFAHKLGHFEH